MQFKIALEKNISGCSLALAQLLKVKVPNYLSGLPIPETYEGWSKLSSKDWWSLIPPMAVVAGFFYITYCAFCPRDRPKPDPPNYWENVDRYDPPNYWENVYRYDSYVDDLIAKAARCHCGAFQNLNSDNFQQKTRKGKQRQRKSKPVDKMVS